MSEQNHNDGLDDVQVEPLSDEALEEVAGGILPGSVADSSSGTCCSCSSCSSAPPPEA
ncbi:MAG TPA: hypothetical protein VFE05_17845 [Longimicrobiaceae bacterium]|jgi:hypothetical protein|nr:hypothetical protein [Longimicrobiaceae bacterium]